MALIVGGISYIVRYFNREATEGAHPLTAEFDLPMPLMDALGEGVIYGVTMTTALDGPPGLTIDFSNRAKREDIDGLVNHLRACGFQVQYSTEDADSGVVNGWRY